MKVYLILVIIVSGAIFSECTLDFSSNKIYRKVAQSKNDSLQKRANDANSLADPLILTPLIDAGKIGKAKKLARVTNANLAAGGTNLADVLSYSGFLTVNPKYNSNMYFWFVPAADNPAEAPLLLWLQGGGISSLFALFAQNGPFKVDDKNNLHARANAWSKSHSIIYMDNPVGTGFSFTENNNGYAKNQEDVANDLYSALTQFFTLFPELQARDLFISGESYAAKYAASIALKIHKENNLLRSKPKANMNLKGMIIGNGVIDPENMLNYGEYLYSLGLLDYSQKMVFKNEENKARNFIKRKQWAAAASTIDGLLEGDSSHFKNFTGLDSYANILTTAVAKDLSYYADFLDLPDVRQAIHVGNALFSNLDLDVKENLKDDMYQSVADKIVALLDAEEKYRVLLYNGQFDIIAANTLIDNYLRKMQWHGTDDFAAAGTKIWKMCNNNVAGYAKAVDNLTHLIVRNAANNVAYDRPKASLDMIKRFTTATPFCWGRNCFSDPPRP